VNNMTVLMYGEHGSEVKTFPNIETWEKVAETIFKNTYYEDDVFVVLDSNNKILYRAMFDDWKEEQFFNYNGVRIEI
jgi:hypothetical protein